MSILLCLCYLSQAKIEKKQQGWLQGIMLICMRLNVALIGKNCEFLPKLGLHMGPLTCLGTLSRAMA